MIVNSLSKAFNKCGSRLLVKTGKLPIKNYKGHHFTKDAKYFSIANVETNFGKGRANIFSVFNNDGKLIERMISKNVVNGNSSVTVSKYNYFAGGVKKESLSFNNPGLVQESRTILFDGIHKNLIRTYNCAEIMETQIDKNLYTGKYVKTSAKRSLNDNYISRDKKIRYDYMFYDRSVEGSDLSKDKIKFLTDCPYTFCRNYNSKDFLQAIISRARKTRKVENVNPFVSKLVFESENVLGRLIPGTPFVYLNKNLNDKSDIVNVINHEFHHLYQDTFVRALYNQGLVSSLKLRDVLNGKVSIPDYLASKIYSILKIDVPKVSGKKVDKAKAYFEAARSYPSDRTTEAGFLAYESNLLEKEAFKIGDREEEKFNKMLCIIDAINY